MDAQKRLETLGPAERVVQSLTTFSDHMVHNRPGLVESAPGVPLGVLWAPAIWKEEEGKKVVYKSVKVGKRTNRVKVGSMNGTLEIKDGRKKIGEFRNPGLYPEVAAYYYRQIADVWKLDNEFAARWASWAFPKEHRDLKVALAAFMLVQSRKGDAVVENGETLFYDEDYRAVGEAMCLIRAKEDLNPKLLMRIGDVLEVPEVVEINRELGFGKTARKPIYGRYYDAVEKWLRYREENSKMLEGLVKAGFKRTVMALAQKVGYKPTSSKFFEILRWKQTQSKDGRRQMAIGQELTKAETWEGKTEKQICKIITKDKPNWKRIYGQLPVGMGITAAILSAAVEAGCMSDQDLIILTPTLEELGLLKDKDVKARWDQAVAKAENQRAAHIVKNVKTKEAKEGLEAAVDNATAKALEKATKNLRVYCMVDKSGSMMSDGALNRAQAYLTKFLGGFPLDRLHVSVFNTAGTEVIIKAPKAAAVRQAFMGHSAGGGTSYGEGVLALRKHKPTLDEDALMLFVGDEEDSGAAHLVAAVQETGINPVAFGLLKILINGMDRGRVVRDAAAMLGIPCFMIDENMFTSDDPYAITRLLQNLISSTPVGKPTVAQPIRVARKTLVQEILETPLLQKPLFARTVG